MWLWILLVSEAESEMEGEDPNTIPQRDFKSGETQSGEGDWEVPSTDDPLGEGVGPGGQRWV